MRVRLLVALLAIALVAAPACKKKPAVPAGGPAAVLEGQGIQLSSVPAAFRVVSSSGGAVVLEPADAARAGRIRFTVLPEAAGTNLVAAVTNHREEVSDREGAAYDGSQELVGPLGSAFWSRGGWEEDHKHIEQTKVFTLHPDHQRIIELDYVYPEGDDSPQRVQELLDILGTLAPADEAPAK